MARKKQILVVGHNGSACTDKHRELARQAGAAIARAGAVLVSGGLGGIMEASCRGAKEAGGITVGIIPYEDASEANEFCDIVIPTGMGMTRDFINSLSADGLVIIGGGVGTLSEMCAAYMHRKPMVAVRGSAGSADRFVGQYLDQREKVKVLGADTPEEAVRMLLDIIGS